MNSYFDEKLVIEQMLEAQRTADRAQALGLMQGGRPVRRRRLRARLGQALVVLGEASSAAGGDPQAGSAFRVRV